MERRYRLKCINCGRTHDHTCRICECGGILTPVYDTDSAERIIPEIINRADLGMGRFSPLLPADPASVSMGEGDTPLTRSMRNGERMGVKNLHFKNETVNPTGSFKDRSLVVMVAQAEVEGYSTILLASTGNAGISMSAYANRCGLTPCILMDERIPVGKWEMMVALNATAIGVRNLFKGTHQDLIDLLDIVSSELNAYNAFCWALANPVSTEGIKTISYELAYQMEEPPDFIITPAGGGDNLFGIWKGFNELLEMDVIDRIPVMIGVQSERACPLVISFKNGSDHVIPVKNPDSIASGINVAFTGDHALKAIKESGGTAVSVSDKSIVEGKKNLLKEGLIVETTSGCVIPAVEKLLSEGFIDPSDSIVCILTGSGLKETGYVETVKAPVTDRKPEEIVRAIRSRTGGD